MKMLFKHKITNFIPFLGVIFAIFISSIGYSVLNSELYISGEALVQSEANIRITSVNFTELNGDSYERYNSKNTKDTITIFPTLPNSDSSIIYKLDIVNKTSSNYGIASITLLDERLEYELIDYNLKEQLCSSVKCNNGNTDNLYIKIKYKDGMYDGNNIDFSTSLTFQFEYIYKVFYYNIENSYYLKDYAMGNTDFIERIAIDNPNRFSIKMNNQKLNATDYSYTDGTLTIYNVSGNISITIPNDKVFDLSAIEPNTAFNLGTSGFDVFSHTLYAEIELPSLDGAKALEDILSFGTDINLYSTISTKNCGRIHVYYPSTLTNTNIQFDLIKVTSSATWIKLNTDLDLSGSKNNTLKMAFNSNGLYVNGKKIFDANGIGADVTSNKNTYVSFLSDFFTTWANQTDMTVGSLEGATRSSAKYNDVRIYNNLMTANELIEITTIETDYKPEEFTYTETINEPYSSNGEKFYFQTPTFTSLDEKTIYLEMDIENMTGAALQGIFSFGDKIEVWSSNSAVNLHMYYTKGTSQITIGVIQNGLHKQFRKTLSVDNNKIKIALGKNGLYINGVMVLNNQKLGSNMSTLNGTSSDALDTYLGSFFSTITSPDFNASMGSQEGSSRSTATYTSLKIYDEVLDTHILAKITQ